MKKLAKKVLSIILGINGFLSSNLLRATATLSSEEQAAVQEMSDALKSATTPIAEKAMNELVGANVRADSKEPEKFQSNVKIELDRVQFDTSRLLGRMKKWGQIKITFHANTNDKNVEWAENCDIKFYVGYNGCRSDGRMLLFKTDCTCAILPTNTEQSVLFFLPGDIRQRHNLNRIPDYCAVHFRVNGIGQPIVVVNKDGKNTYRSDSETHHKDMKKRSHIEDRIMRNVDQLPIYADIRVSDHPTLLLPVDA
ncbi:MAG: hypothetical protein LBQ03_01155 [Puniceicoccales bacterium]|nr:hypothetical protein [Puniceicoccales bacterium]